MSIEMKKEMAEKALDDYLDDMSVPPEQAVENGRELIELIEMKIDGLKQSYPELFQ